MRRIVVMNHMTLDGVMQAPGRADEDRRDGFAHGGWGVPRSDAALVKLLGERMAGGGGFLFGRRTYEDLLSHWNSQPDSPFGAALNNAPKYVASTTLREPLPWPNSTLLQGNVAEAVAALKAEPGGDLGIMGSGALIQTLLAHNLIDEFLLMIHPLVLGSGHRLFPAGSPLTTLRLVDATTTPSGVVVARYQAPEPAPPRSA